MKENSAFSCFLVGEDSLVIKCGELLRRLGVNILGVISPLPLVEDWAAENNLSYFANLSIAEKHLKNDEFDYLFSIVNRQILPDYLLQRANKFSINYHDSPLPRYAGVSATCWAILNDEKTHAVTWHIMTDKLDAGDILKQKTFDIDGDETALSLNLKCYQHAVDLFSELFGSQA